MITRIIDRNDSRAGHTYRWVQEIGRQLAPGKLSVLCLERGDISGLPENVSVHSLGKERGRNRLFRWFLFPLAAWPLVHSSDAVFCHQNPEYTIAVWLFAKMQHKRLVAWYTHGTITWKTRLMVRFADVVLTASAESLRSSTPKRRIIGHGIDTEQFKYLPFNRELNPTQLRIVTVGRIAPTKDIETLILAVAKLRDGAELKTEDDRPVAVTLKVVGAPALPSDKEYFTTLQELVKKLRLEREVRFVGPVPYGEVAPYYQPERTDLIVNLSGTGSLDKAVLEAMACGCPVITSNLAFQGVVPLEYIVPPNDQLKLAQAIRTFFLKYRYEGVNLEYQLSRQLRQTVEQSHSLTHLVKEILSACRA